MRQDSLISARRIRNPINSHSDIAAAFDRITYTKGQAVIRMFEAWLGEEDFRAGVRRYLKQYAWGNASAGDFLDALASREHPGVGAAFATFLNQGGVPLISVALDCSAESAPALVLAQQRALPTGSQGSAGQLWRTPFCVRYEAEGKTQRECFLLAEPSARWTLSQATSCPAWLSPTAGGEGYYQVGYDDGLLKPLLANRGAVLTAAERISVAGDVQAGFEMGTLEAGSALALVPEFAGDPDRNVVTATIRIAGRIWPHMVEDDLQANYIRFLNTAFGEHAAKLGWTPAPGEDEDTRLLRAQTVFFMATRGEQQELARQASELASRWLEDRRALPPEIVSAVISTAAYQGGRELFDRYLAALGTTTNRQERQQLYGALGSFRDPEIANDALALLLDEKHDIRESLGTLWTSQSTPQIRRLRWEFVKQNFDALIARLPAQGGFQLGARLPDVGNVFCSSGDARELEQFFGERVKKFNGGEQNLAETLEGIRLCSALKNAQQESVSAFLRGY
jgi:alanyl aminopeptidase